MASAPTMKSLFDWHCHFQLNYSAKVDTKEIQKIHKQANTEIQRREILLSPSGFILFQKLHTISILKAEAWQCQHQYLSILSLNMYCIICNCLPELFISKIYEMDLHENFHIFPRHWNIQGIFKALWYCRQHGWLNVPFAWFIFPVTFQTRSWKKLKWNEIFIKFNKYLILRIRIHDIYIQKCFKVQVLKTF